MSHTPGPWTASQHGDYFDYDGRSIVILGDDDTIRVATAIGDDDEETNANARLIAAAPDLLDALQACVRQITALCSKDDVPDQAFAAIAKAMGEQS